MPEIATPLRPDDDGEADEHVVAALSSQDPYAIAAALSDTRLFVAVLAALISKDESGKEKESEMSLALLEMGDQRALPVFSSLERLMSWRADARPVSVSGQGAALQALADSMAAMVINPGSQDSFTAAPPMLRALALEYAYLPFAQDPDVEAALQEAVDQEPEVVTAWLDEGEDVDALVTVLIPDLPVEQARTIAVRVAERCAADQRVRLRAHRGLDVQVVAAR
jgi:hypothetical protein